MNISTLTTTRTSVLSTSSTSNQSTDKVTIAPSLKKADVRLQGLLDTTTANLSAMGKFKASVSDVQLAAQALSKFTSTSKVEDVTKAVAEFAADFNAMVATTISSVAQAAGVGNISRGMSRAMTADFSRINDLSQIGFTKGADGTLTLDKSKFEAAYANSPSKVQAVLAKLGNLVDKTATKELGSDGRITSSLATLNTRSSALQAQQSALIKVSQQFAQFSSSSSGLSAYWANA